MRQYPIWNEVTACIYNSSKSYGAQDRSAVSVKVGSSASNSHGFISHETTRSVKDTDKGRIVVFSFYVCGQLIKETTFTAGRNDRAETKISEKCAYIGTMRNKKLKAA